MWKFGIKSKVDVASSKGDTIKNSQIIMGDNHSSMLSEVYRAIGRLEGNVKCMSKDVAYIRSKIEDHDEKLAKISILNVDKDFIKKG